MLESEIFLAVTEALVCAVPLSCHTEPLKLRLIFLCVQDLALRLQRLTPKKPRNPFCQPLLLKLGENTGEVYSRRKSPWPGNLRTQRGVLHEAISDSKERESGSQGRKEPAKTAFFH